MATAKKVANDATASVSGTLYQICVALEQAFLLQEGQKIWIEKFGDVTVSGEEQIETKLYSDILTDSHPNFWNTLKNWMLPSFDCYSYKYLTLFTTQPIGERSLLNEWNEATIIRRIEILEEIRKNSEERFQEKQKTNKNKKLTPPQNLMDQRFVLDPQHEVRLQEIIPKIYISSNSPGMIALRKKIIDIHGKTILKNKCDDFIDDLIGYIISPSRIASGWEITFAEFSRKLIDVTNRYRSGTVVFPARQAIFSVGQVDLHREKRFVKKLLEIEYQEAILEAISNYLQASLILIEDFKNYEVDANVCELYQDNLRRSHVIRHRAARRCLTGDPINASKTFYDDVTGEAPQPFPRFDLTPLGFRNGVLHMLADAEADEFQWRLW